ncbi:hypothetical protein K5M33_22900 [Chromobacterium vaccinii]|nr:hypothetical protein [Chromobacterium vaccinii]MBX9359557.1 hypothetical protein [Chromobacterium vaccinii]
MLEFVIEKLIALLGPIATLSKEKRELKDNALRSVSTALRETQLYYRDLGKGKDRSMDIEALLAKYWSAAAIPLRHIDEELAMACEHKAEYWVNPEQWSGEEIARLGIKLEDVEQAYRNIAMPKFSKAGRVART